ncbi:MAG: hypothetical protein WCL04_01135 [Verrucomicrobiota bacterium]
MALPPITIVWMPRQQKADWKLGGLFGHYRRGGGGPWMVAVSVSMVLAWGGALLLAAFFSGAAIKLRNLDTQPNNSITYADLVLPWRWSQLNAKRGQDLIERGLSHLRDKRPNEAYKELEYGLQRDPHSTKGRIELAQFQMQLAGRQKAEATLLAGLDRGYPGRAYLTQLFGVAAAGENFPLWLKACDLALAQLDGKPQLAPDRQSVLRQKLSALIAANRSDEAVRLAEAEGDTQGEVMREFKTLALLKTSPATAADFLAQWREQARRPEEITQVRRLQVRVFRETGRTEDMNRVLEELRAADPVSASPYVYGIIQRLLAGEHDAAEKSYDTFFLRFGAKLPNLVLLAEPLAEVGEEPLLRQLIEQARTQRLNLLPLQRALAAAQIKNAHWKDAATTVAAMRPALPKDKAEAQLWLAWMSATIAAASSPAADAQSAFVNFIHDHQHQLPLALFRDALATLRRAGRPETAQRVLAVARGAFPDSVTLRDQEKDLIQEVALAQAASQSSALPAPKLAVVIASETEFFQTLTDAMAAGDHTAARAQIMAARATSPVPGWVADHAAELDRDEVLIAARLHDLTGLAAAAARWLNGTTDRANAALALARELRATDASTEAERLLDTVLRRMPGFAPAARLLAEWRPAVATPTPATTPAITAATLANEVLFMAALTATLQTSDSAAALAQIRAVRTANPAWLATRDAELRSNEIILNGRLGENTAMTSAARLFLNGDRDRSQAAIELAKQLHDTAHPAEAVRLIQEVLRKTPGFVPATRQLAEWDSAK